MVVWHYYPCREWNGVGSGNSGTRVWKNEKAVSQVSKGQPFRLRERLTGDRSVSHEAIVVRVETYASFSIPVT